MSNQNCTIGKKVEWLPRKVKRVFVEKGCLWITNKEGKDILLSSGESVQLCHGPFLIQGLKSENHYRSS